MNEKTPKARMWRLWSAMKQRCYNPNRKDYSYYGGRGIRVCNSWMKFHNFLSDVGFKPVGMCLDRIDNNKGYSPGNCRWVTMEQQNNNRRNNVRVRFNGKNFTYSQWDRFLGVKIGTTRNRLINAGWSKRRALTQPTAKPN